MCSIFHPTCTFFSVLIFNYANFASYISIDPTSNTSVRGRTELTDVPIADKIFSERPTAVLYDRLKLKFIIEPKRSGTPYNTLSQKRMLRGQ